MKKTFGARLKEARTEKHLTQEDLANEIGLTGGFIGQLERDESLPSIDTVTKIAKFLNISTDELLFDYVTDTNFLDNEILLLVKDLPDAAKLHLIEYIKMFKKYLGKNETILHGNKH